MPGLDEGFLGKARNVVYLVIDGVGCRQWEALLESGGGEHFYGQQPARMISTVFPATTAAAVTTFATGASPLEHAILGWHLHMADLGMVGTILPMTTRTGVPMVPEDFDLHQYLQLPSYLDTVRGRRVLLSYAHIPFSGYSLAGTRWHERGGFRTLRGVERQILRVARDRRRSVVYAYWPTYDSLCHEHGCFAKESMEHLADVDAVLGRLVKRLAGTSTLLFVLADHGLVDVPDERLIDLMDVPGLMDCLTVLPSGDAREVNCFVRPGRVKDFESIYRARLREYAVMLTGQQLLEMGVFGPGQPHPAFAARLGDYVLLARENCAFGVTVPGNEKRFNRGNHGGMSPEEVLVPLFSVCCK
jgi:predicted AlkP superfamily pyrophosphatase or phosphodiesterase